MIKPFILSPFLYSLKGFSIVYSLIPMLSVFFINCTNTKLSLSFSDALIEFLRKSMFVLFRIKYFPLSNLKAYLTEFPENSTNTTSEILKLKLSVTLNNSALMQFSAMSEYVSF